MKITYHAENVFAKIIRGEIPSDVVYESDHSLAFKDVNPRAKVHVLVIPKKSYINFSDFSSKASQAEKIDIFESIIRVAEKENLIDEGYRVLTNCGENGHQEVQHLHFHILGGQPLGSFIKKLDIT